ncbi:MAG: hypothetical protein M1825_001770 [Sarcosagium campestre]|nr:MAG: hypothetical protein M1825_001770 [Sarcosagium campestre]
MPSIEVLPASKAQANTPGWAYVPDTGYDPSKASLAPSNTKSRHRVTARRPNATHPDLTARQQTAVLKRLADLDRDNSQRDVQIPVPARVKDAAGRVIRSKATPFVRRILGSQKTFANHLADEEAATSTAELAPPTSSALHTLSSPQTPAPSTPRSSKAGNLPAAASKLRHALVLSPTPPPRTMDTDSQEDGQKITTKADGDHPLLRSYIPSLPSSAALDTLTACPPLSYGAARAAPSAAVQRHFCEICGYWGRIKCIKCGARVCGLECKGVHDEGRCLRFYA